MIEKQNKKEILEIKEFLHKFSSDRWFRMEFTAC